MNRQLGYHKSKKWMECVALEYVLTWGYTKNKNKDEKRYKYLSEMFWNRRLKEQYKLKKP